MNTGPVPTPSSFKMRLLSITALSSRSHPSALGPRQMPHLLCFPPCSPRPSVIFLREESRELHRHGNSSCGMRAETSMAMEAPLIICLAPTMIGPSRLCSSCVPGELFLSLLGARHASFVVPAGGSTSPLSSYLTRALTPTRDPPPPQ